VLGRLTSQLRPLVAVDVAVLLVLVVVGGRTRMNSKIGCTIVMVHLMVPLMVPLMVQGHFSLAVVVQVLVAKFVI
jgi:hypothetical protein